MLMAYGGHNNFDKLIEIKNSVFKGFVNMSDAWFNGPLEIVGCNFIEGTNLLGNKGTPIQVTFDQDPILYNNSGKMDLDDYEPHTA